jgi:hypothetical protein
VIGFTANPRDARPLLTTALELPATEVLPRLQALVDHGRITPADLREHVSPWFLQIDVSKSV